jgi:hypothetical protein
LETHTSGRRIVADTPPVHLEKEPNKHADTARASGINR